MSKKIRDYIESRGDLKMVRCCVKGWKVQQHIEKMPEGEIRDSWIAMPETADIKPGDETYSLCHKCTNILDESRPGVKVHSLWELIDSDPNFKFPDYTGMNVTLQDCWRSKDRPEEQKQIMDEYCSHYKTKTIVCYCHYCLDGLKVAEVDGRHLAFLLFGE